MPRYSRCAGLVKSQWCSRWRSAFLAKWRGWQHHCFRWCRSRVWFWRMGKGKKPSRRSSRRSKSLTDEKYVVNAGPPAICTHAPPVSSSCTACRMLVDIIQCRCSSPGTPSRTPKMIDPTTLFSITPSCSSCSSSLLGAVHWRTG